VIWERRFWEAYDYFGYPKEMSLPQLDCFIDAGLTRKVVASNRAVFLRGDAEPTNVKGFWFYARNPLLEAFEYPTLYRKVLNSPQLDPRTRFWIHARRARMLLWTARKVLFISHNRDYYHPRMTDFRAAHGGSLYWPLLWLYLTLVLKTRVGWQMAALYCNRILRADKLPAQERMTHEF
jgi:hypothetical protein